MRNGLEQLKLETAAELGILNYDQIDKGALPARVNGMIGGMMVRKMIHMAQSALAAQELGEGAEIVISSVITDHDRKRVQETMLAMSTLQNSIPEPYQVEQIQFEQQRLH